MAKKKRSSDSPVMWTPPSAAEMSDMAIKEAAQRATMAHPHVMKMQKKMEAEMRKAAHMGMDYEKSGEGGKEW